VDDMIAGVPAPKVGDKVEVVQRAVGRFKGPVLAIDEETITVGVTYPTGKVKEARIARKSILEFRNLGA
jgi:hypothetical protein